jgi:RND family efflux transporter MFP subunit
MSSKLLKIIIPVIVLVAGIAAAAFIASSRTAPPRQEHPPLGPLVDVMPAEVGEVDVLVTGHGEVVPKVAIDVVPQVAGRVVAAHPSLVAGGFFTAGEVLVVIDPRDYELAVDRSKAAVARATVTLEREEAEAEVARAEWYGLNPGEEPSGLVVREPQVRQAKAELEAARADLAMAELNLERTRVTVPFDGVVVSESVDEGQFVSTGARLARVYGTESVEVRVPLDSRELAWFDVPARAGGAGAEAEVRTSFGGGVHTWRGRVTRMEAEVNPTSRMVHVVIEVPRPYRASQDRPALVPGTFVDVSIFGRSVQDVASLPRHAMHDGGRVWVFEDGTLRIREVEVLRADREATLVREGLDQGDLVIISPLDAVTDGMTVRIANGSPENSPSTDAEEIGAADGVAALRNPAGGAPHDLLPDPHPAIRDQRIARGAA